MKAMVFDSNLLVILKTFGMSVISVCPDRPEIRVKCYTLEYYGPNRILNSTFLTILCFRERLSRSYTLGRLLIISIVRTFIIPIEE